MYPRKPNTRVQTSPHRLSNYYSLRPREQIKSLLVNKYRIKYGALKRPELDSIIKQEVESLMRKDKVYQSHLQTLERRIKSLIPRPADKSHAKVADTPNANDLKVPRAMNASLIVRSDNMKLDESTSSLLPSINKSQIISQSKNQWAKILEYDFIKYKEDIKKGIELENMKKKKVRAELDRQVKEKVQAQEDAKKMNYQKDMEIIKKAKIQEEIEAKKTSEIKKKTVQERMVRNKQLQEEYERKRKEREQELISEKTFLEKLRDEMQKEQLSTQKKRQQELEHARKVLAENERNKKIREEEKKKAYEAEKVMIEKYKKAIEEQERKRQDELKAKEARIQAFLKLTADTVVKKDEMKRKEEEQKILNELTLREQKEKEEEERRKKIIREKEKSMKTYLDAQVKEKHVMLEVERRKNRELAEGWERDAKEYLRQEQMKVEEQKKRQKELRTNIIKQIMEKRENLTKEIEMTQLEEAINKKILDNAASFSS